MSQARTILLIIDEPTLGAITGFRLELMGYEVVTAATAEEAQEHLARSTPGLIVLDLLLGEGEGFHIADRLSNDDRTSQIPLLALSSNADLSEVQRAFAAGAKDYLVTPFDPTVLESKLARWLPVSD